MAWLHPSLLGVARLSDGACLYLQSTGVQGGDAVLLPRSCGLCLRLHVAPADSSAQELDPS